MSAVLASIAHRLNREAGSPAIPALYLLTDPTRMPDPIAAVRRLPAGAAVIYRHFGAADRFATARALAAVCRRRRLLLLIGADAPLARAVGADGVHLPERLAMRAPTLKARGWRLVTSAAHSARALAQARGDAVLLSAVFSSASASAGAALGPLRAGRLTRVSARPVIALGGVSARTARLLPGHGFAGLAAIEGLTPART